MKKSEMLANRLREVLLEGTWIANTNFKDQMDSLDWKAAVTQVQSFNTIALLAQHVHYYINGINHLYRTGKLEIRDKFSFDFPPIESAEQWESFLQRFWQDAEELASFVEKMSDEELDEPFVDEKYGSYQRNIDGMIEHSYYHLGQISLLKKAILNPE
jgi:hypothetical protein